MEFTALEQLKNRKPSDVLVLPFFQKNKMGIEAADFTELSSSYSLPLTTKDFTAKEGEVLFLYCDQKQEKRIVLVGLGEEKKISMEILRRAFGALLKGCLARKLKSLTLVLPSIDALDDNATLRGTLEGILLTNYGFTKLKGKSNEEAQGLLEKIALISRVKPSKALAYAEKCSTICKAVNLARDLVNSNADEITPEYLAQVALDLAKILPNAQAHILTKKELEKEKMGLLLAVSRGSEHDPVLITLTYHGDVKSTKQTVLIGKGVTYDTGGLNIKPTGGMETMKCDMAGAATSLGTFLAVASLGLKVNLTVVIPSTENAISSKSYKPGDVYKSHSGKTVEIGNTDAEGRLILADALSYAIKKFKPTCVIDIATLTGAIDIALGPEASGLFCNEDALAEELYKAGEATFERVWRMPLYPEYRDQLKSDIADLKNIGGRSAGSIKAALFLKEFVGETPWAHLDIASTAYLGENKRYHPKHATGIGVRLFVEFLEGQQRLDLDLTPKEAKKHGADEMGKHKSLKRKKYS
ncbi:MAG: leucyl aminopeptidase [Parachlamydiaceae bacterium]|nr:leucyl aminopeptidase [Parachlamydiaceae bacterium]